MKNRFLSVVTMTISLLACLLAVPLHAQTHEHEVIYTTIPGWPQSDVPGMPGFTFYDLADYAPQVAVSPTGQHVITAQAYDGNTAPWILVGGGQTLLVQDDPAPWAPGETIDSAGYSGVAVNSSGAIAAICETNVREYVVYSTTPGTWSVHAQEGGPTHPYPSATYTRFESVALDDPGAIGFLAFLTGGPTNALLEQGGSVLAHVNLDTPTDQLGSGSYTYQSFYPHRRALRLAPDGTHWMGSAHLNDPGNSQVMQVDNAVVVQEGYTIPGSGLGNIAWDNNTLVFDSAGRWYGTGRFYPNGNDMWAMRDGALLAATGLETYPGSGEYWSGYADNLEFATGNGGGDWFVGGNIAVPPYGQEARVVKNGAETLLSDGDPIDMDGNGVFDDNVIFRWVTSFAQATDDGSLFMVGRLFDATQGAHGFALLRIGPPLPGTGYCFGDPGSGITCPCSNDNDGSVPGSGCANGAAASGAQLTGSGIASVSADTLVLTTTGLHPYNSGLYFQANNAVNGGDGNVLGDGLRCAGAGLIRLQIRTSSGSGASSTTIPIAAKGGIFPGDTKRYQCWYRDTSGNQPCGVGVNDFNLSNGYEVTWLP